MSKAVTPIQDELKLNDPQISLVMMAFTLAYGVFAVPAGRLGDKTGSRAVLAGMVIGWSAFTSLTGAAFGLVSLIVVRLFFGATEAGAFPNAARVISRWFPLSERGWVQGVMLAAGQFGAVAAPVGAAYLIELLGWRGAFSVFGFLGVLWAIGFWYWFRDNPAEHPGVNEAELAIIRADAPPPPVDPGPVPWAAVVVNRGVIVLSLIMVFGAFYTYFFYSWFPKYLEFARGVPKIEAGWLASLVLAGSAVGMLIGGWLAGRIPDWVGDPVLARRRLGVVCYLIAAGCLFTGVRCDDPLTMASLWGASFCAMHVTLPNWWSVAIPQGGKHVGTIFGLMNGLGVIGAMASQGFVGLFAYWQEKRGLSGREQWDPIFDIYVVVLIAAALAWWLYRLRPVEPIDGKILDRTSD